jgi:hypothetical protein
MTRAEIGLSVLGVVSASYNIYLHWKFGGKQDAITSGTDKIVDQSNKLLDRMDTMIAQEREHREHCETSLKELRQEIELLKQKTL